jgi:cytochrome c
MRNIRTLKISSILLATVALAAGLASATTGLADAELAKKGKMIVQEKCSRCHAVDKSDTSQLPMAPPFREFAAKWSVENLEEALAEGIVTGHPDMPVFQFEPEDIAAITEHLHEISDRADRTPQ